MGHLVDFPCVYDKKSGLDNSAQTITGFKISEAYKNWQSIAELAMLVKKTEQTAFCRLPFCHTLEGEALGSRVTPGDEISGPRIKEYNCSNIDEFLNLRDIDYNAGRIGRVLKACRFLREKGENVVLEISGPFTILNTLLDPHIVFRTFKKKPETICAIFDKLRGELQRYFEKALSAGVTMISYADPCGGLDILGPQLAKEAVILFTYPFLKNIEKITNGRALVILCPKTAYALIGTEYAQWRELSLGRPVSYAEGCALAVGRANFVGQTCIKNEDSRLASGLIKVIDLSGFAERKNISCAAKIQ